MTTAMLGTLVGAILATALLIWQGWRALRRVLDKLNNRG